ncbi:hypothetical protein FNV43_RR20905 [Rhamnella rubrinervis]|uniref:Early response to dehydration 15-like protein n=1 Tax=Rhamnella rubrinervis TaxID=2594499 RepID=A0A8K0E1M4_9ROSA|nr:hypothetical protein FNV43_RR20905 [Rhamnella rubrinervis]
MALVAGGRSSLNANAPLYVPAVLRQVEDFSPEWWALVKTSPWFCDYWLNQHEEDDFDGSADAVRVAADMVPRPLIWILKKSLLTWKLSWKIWLYHLKLKEKLNWQILLI